MNSQNFDTCDLNVVNENAGPCLENCLGAAGDLMRPESSSQKVSFSNTNLCRFLTRYGCCIHLILKQNTDTVSVFFVLDFWSGAYALRHFFMSSSQSVIVRGWGTNLPFLFLSFNKLVNKLVNDQPEVQDKKTEVWPTACLHIPK